MRSRLDDSREYAGIVRIVETGKQTFPTCKSSGKPQQINEIVWLQRGRQAGALVDRAFCIQFGSDIRPPDNMRGPPDGD